MQKTLLITGWLWYIWSHTAVAFSEAWYTIIIVDNLINSNKKALLGIEAILGYLPNFYDCDIRDEKRLENIFEKHSFDGVIHLAGLKAVWESCEKPLLYHENNIGGSITLFKMMEKYNVKNIVFSSSATVYDSSNASPLRETDKLGTTNPYGTTKLVIEKILVDLSKQSSWKSIALRYFNPIGAHESWELGENPKGVPNNILPYIMKVASWELKEIQIFWNDYETRDGTGVRDYIDILDLADAHLSAYRKIETEKYPLYEAVNIGTGSGTSVLELISLVEETVWKSLPKKIVWRRPGDIGEVYACVDYAKEYLNWQATKAIKTSLKNGWNFIQKKGS